MNSFADMADQGLESMSRQALAPPGWSRELFKVNEFYAHDLVLKRHAGISYSQALPGLIEHGLVLGRTLVENVKRYPLAKMNIVMSEPRARFLREQGIPAVTIGPYIHYARPVLDEEKMLALKQRLGKTLLFFVSHSIGARCAL